MGTIMDAYKIVTDLKDRSNNKTEKKRLKLADYLTGIASILDAARDKLKREEIPRREGKELAILINHAEQLVNDLKDETAELKEVFETQLPKVGELLSNADVFIEWKSRYELREDAEVFTPYSPYRATVIEEACKEMQRAAGVLSGYARKFQ